MADRHGQPLSFVLENYPAWELPYWAAWYSREPTDGQRVEFAVARFMCSWASAHTEKGKPKPKVSDYLIKDYWEEKAEVNRKAAGRRDFQMMVDELKSAGMNIIERKPENITEEQYL